MRKNRKVCILLFIVVCIAALLAWSLRPRVANTSKEFLENGDFSVAAEDGLPDAWYEDAYIWKEGYTSYELLESAGPEGQRAVHITNHEQNDARVAQQVAVEPDTLYCLSGLIKAKTEGGRGANLSIEGVSFIILCTAYVMERLNDWWAARKGPPTGRTGSFWLLWRFTFSWRLSCLPRSFPWSAASWCGENGWMLSIGSVISTTDEKGKGVSVS